MWLVKTYHRHSGNTCFSLSLYESFLLSSRNIVLMTYDCCRTVFFQNCLRLELQTAPMGISTGTSTEKCVQCFMFSVFLWNIENPIHLVLHTYPRRQLGLAWDPFFLESTWDVLYEGDGISDMPTKGDPSNQSCWALTNLYKASAPTSLWRSNGNPVPNDLPQLP